MTPCPLRVPPVYSSATTATQPAATRTLAAMTATPHGQRTIHSTLCRLMTWDSFTTTMTILLRRLLTKPPSVTMRSRSLLQMLLLRLRHYNLHCNQLINSNRHSSPQVTSSRYCTVLYNEAGKYTSCQLCMLRLTLVNANDPTAKT